jgi:hypothetical protein
VGAAPGRGARYCTFQSTSSTHARVWWADAVGLAAGDVVGYIWRPAGNNGPVRDHMSVKGTYLLSAQLTAPVVFQVKGCVGPRCVSESGRARGVSDRVVGARLSVAKCRASVRSSIFSYLYIVLV